MIQAIADSKLEMHLRLRVPGGVVQQVLDHGFDENCNIARIAADQLRDAGRARLSRSIKSAPAPDNARSCRVMLQTRYEFFDEAASAFDGIGAACVMMVGHSRTSQPAGGSR
jgi:hypothetical protein